MGNDKMCVILETAGIFDDFVSPERHIVLLSAKCSSSVWGHSIGAFPIFADLAAVHVVSRKRLIVE